MLEKKTYHSESQKMKIILLLVSILSITSCGVNEIDFDKKHLE